jgi:taurine dioxygenase
MSQPQLVAISRTRVRTEIYTPNIGATVSGVDLAEAASDRALHADLRAALAEHQVLFFRDQHLTPEQQVSVARIFGDPDKAKAFFPRLAGHSLVEVIESKPGVHRYTTDQWHTDITFSANPPTGTVLYAREIPPQGGDTLWASAPRVYDALPDKLRDYLADLEAVHSFEHSGWPRFFLSQPDGEALYRKARADYLPVTHPVIRTHPVTGRKLVYVNPNFTDHIKDLPRLESDALLTLLFGYFQRPEFHARLRWEKHTVAIWDNRATQHFAVADDDAWPRVMHRVTFGEDRAF